MTRDFIKVVIEKSVRVIELRLPEMLDSEEFDQLNQSLLREIDVKVDGRWLLDLSHVDYMGSSVLGLMINIRQHIKTGGGKLVLNGLSPRLANIFRTCCLEKLFQISKTREEGVRQLGGR